MGIKGLKDYLDKKKLLRFKKEHIKHGRRGKRNLILLDVLAFMRKIYKIYERTVSLLFDFSWLLSECKKMKALFEKFGFKLVVFMDGHFINDKAGTCMKRYREKYKENKKKIQMIRKLENEYVMLILLVIGHLCVS